MGMMTYPTKFSKQFINASLGAFPRIVFIRLPWYPLVPLKMSVTVMGWAVQYLTDKWLHVHARWKSLELDPLLAWPHPYSCSNILSSMLMLAISTWCPRCFHAPDELASMSPRSLPVTGLIFCARAVKSDKFMLQATSAHHKFSFINDGGDIRFRACRTVIRKFSKLVAIRVL